MGVQDGARWHTEANAHRHHHATSEASAPSTPFGTRYLAVEPFLLAASASLVMMTGAVAVATTVAVRIAIDVATIVTKDGKRGEKARKEK